MRTLLGRLAENALFAFVLIGAGLVIGSLLVVTWIISRLIPTDTSGIGPDRQIR